jgi:acetyltransferase-like isoleucine patch superfamily enzyme
LIRARAHGSPAREVPLAREVSGLLLHRATSPCWAFAHVCDGAVIGEDCNLCDHTFFEKGVRVGNRVTIKCGVYLWEGAVLEDDVFVGPCVAFTNDLRPRSRKYPDKFLATHLQQGCAVGANATILPVTIGCWAMVAAGVVVTGICPLTR